MLRDFLSGFSQWMTWYLGNGSCFLERENAFTSVRPLLGGRSKQKEFGDPMGKCDFFGNDAYRPPRSPTRGRARARKQVCTTPVVRRYYNLIYMYPRLDMYTRLTLAAEKSGSKKKGGVDRKDLKRVRKTKMRGERDRKRRLPISPGWVSPGVPST